MEHDERDRCTCYYVSEHDGSEASTYAREHLEQVRVDSVNWTTEYRCPLYGKRWIADEPWGELHGGGPIRLRTVDKACRDLKTALATVPILFGPELGSRADELREALPDCAEVGRS